MSTPPPASERRICSVTVAFHANPERLAEQLAALATQVDEMIVVDNGCTPAVERMEGLPRERVRVLAMAENVGIAAGFNAGAREAFAAGAHMVLLLDDDSVPQPGMVGRLVAAYEASVPRHEVAALGPRIQDARDARDYPFIRLGWTHNRHLRCADGAGETIACDFLISSGSLIPRSAYEAVGAFDESLFIDSVDLEWCCRARSRGMLLLGVCGARLDHRLGDRRKRVLHMDLVVHSPERIYYMTRNRFMLYGRAYMPLRWKAKDLLRVLAKFAATMLLIAPRREYARMSARALRDALAGRGGRLREGGA